MKQRTLRFISLGLALCMATMIAGCATYGEAGGLGAATGALAGGIIGHQSGRAIEGAVIGGLVGGAVGLIAHDIKVRRARSRAETEAAYNYTPAQGEMLTLERSEVLPPSARPGELAEASVQYALLGAGTGVQVSEQRTLMLGDRVIADVSTHNFTRDDGTWVSSQPFRVPTNLEPGIYAITTSVRTARSAISSSARFTIQ